MGLEMFEKHSNTDVELEIGQRGVGIFSSTTATITYELKQVHMQIPAPKANTVNEPKTKSVNQECYETQDN